MIVSSIPPPSPSASYRGNVLVSTGVQDEEGRNKLERVQWMNCPDPEFDARSKGATDEDIEQVRAYFVEAMKKAKERGDFDRILTAKAKAQEEKEEEEQRHSQKSNQTIPVFNEEEIKAFYESDYTSIQAIQTLLSGIVWEEHYDDLFYAHRAFWYRHNAYGKKRLDKIQKKLKQQQQQRHDNDNNDNKSRRDRRLTVLDMLHTKKPSRLAAFLRERPHNSHSHGHPMITIYQTLNTSTGGTTAMRLLHHALQDLEYDSFLCNDTNAHLTVCRRPSDDTIAITGEWCHEVMDDYLNALSAPRRRGNSEGNGVSPYHYHLPYAKYPYQFRGRGVQYYLGFHHGRDACRYGL
jgi:hypothetical protein